MKYKLIIILIFILSNPLFVKAETYTFGGYEPIVVLVFGGVPQASATVETGDTQVWVDFMRDYCDKWLYGDDKGYPSFSSVHCDDLGINDSVFPTTPGKFTAVYLNLSYNLLTQVDGMSLVSSLGELLLNNNKLVNVNGLSSLSSVGGYLSLSRNHLTHVDGLSSLTYVGQSLGLERNYVLENVDGLSSLTEVGENLKIRYNSLENINGLSSLTRTGGGLYAEYNNLTNVDGLSSLEYIGSKLYLHENDLRNVDGLSSLTFVLQSITLHANPNLQDLSGLNSLTNVGYGVRFEDRDYAVKMSSTSYLCLPENADKIILSDKANVCEI
jgi:hypothetical protein